MSIRISFLTSNVKPYHGTTRALLGLAATLQRTGHETNILVPGGTALISSYLERDEHTPCRVSSFSNLIDLRTCVNASRSELIVSDDYLPNLVASQQIRRNTKCKTLIYALVFHGLSVLGRSQISKPDVPRLRYLGRYIPWLLLTRRYRQAMLSSDFVVACSRYSESLLYDLYGVIASGVIYPVLGPAFRTSTDNANLRKKTVLLYTGSGAEDTSPKGLGDILRRKLDEKGFDLVSFGSSNNLGDAIRKPCTKLSDLELVHLYKSVSSIVLPQSWEAFGYVGAEAAACHTPVIMWRYQPWLELAGDSAEAVTILDAAHLGSSLERAIDSRPSSIQLAELAKRINTQTSPSFSSSKFESIISNAGL